MNRALRRSGSRGRVGVAALLLFAALPVWAESDAAAAVEAIGPGAVEALAIPVPAEAELDRFLAERGDQPLLELSANELRAVLDLRSTAIAERAHLDRAARLSWVAPGLGHAVSGAYGATILFGVTDGVILFGATAVAIALLPPAVQSRNLNYLQSSFTEIEDRWMALEPQELIPSVVTAVTGAMLSLTIRSLAARSARETAFEAMREGRVVFAPAPLGAPLR